MELSVCLGRHYTSNAAFRVGQNSAEARVQQSAATAKRIAISFGVLPAVALARAQRGRHRKSCRCALHASTAVQEIGDEVSEPVGKSKSERLPIASCVKIWTTGAPPCHLLPWQIADQGEWTGSGCAVLVGGRWRILTNAHVVDNGCVIHVTRQSDSKKVECSLVAVAHDLDLALLDVEDEAFREAVPPVEFASGLPELFSEVEVVGYPEGGSSVCVTKGVVSRVDAHLYAHAEAKGVYGWGYNNPGKLLIVQVDAAINSGNSGGPALDSHGRIVGVASSGIDAAQNIGYIIPSSIVQNLFAELLSSGSWGGIPEPGFTFRTLESSALRDFLQLPEGKTGVQITTVSPMGGLAPHAKQGDLLLDIDGNRISNEGTVLLRLGGEQEVQIPFEHLITGKGKGEQTMLSLMDPQGGPLRTVAAQFAPIPPLVPRFDGFDVWPSFFIFGGLVFSRFSAPLVQEYISSRKTNLDLPRAILETALLQWRQSDEEVIVLLRVLKHSVNEGVRCSQMRILESVNDKPVRTMPELVQAAMSTVGQEDAFARFGFLRYARESSGVELVEVLKADDVMAANEEILDFHKIPAAVSPDLAEVYKAHAPNTL